MISPVPWSAEAAFGWACEASLSASVLILLVWGLRRALPKALGVRGVYLLGLVVLTRLLWPVTPPASSMSVLNLVGDPAVTASAARENVSGRAWSLPADPPTLAPISPQLAEAELAAEAERDELRRPANAMGASSRSWSWTRTAAMLWLAGALGILTAALWQQRRFKVRLRADSEPAGPETLAILDRARGRLRTRRHLRLVLSDTCNIPAVFGWRKPCLILPRSAARLLSQRELLMVFLHELAHVQRHDVLLNWVMTVAQAIHWFNPLAWIALRQLRADRELVCDGAVLTVLRPGDHTLYGSTLLKLLTLHSRPAAGAALVPILRSKPEIERRIRMIPAFNAARKVNWTLTAVLIGALACLTFTRAAGENKKPPQPAPAPSETNAAPSADNLASLTERLAEIGARVRAQQLEVDNLRRQLMIPTDVDNGGKLSMSAEVEQLIERERIAAEAAAIRYESLAKELKARSPAQLAQSLPSAVPDAELMQLLRELNTTQARSAVIFQEYGSEHPEAKAVKATLKTVESQIATRIEGILDGMAAQVAAQRASFATLSKRLSEIARERAERAKAYRPYFEAKRELEILEKVRDSLMLRLVQARYGDLDSPRP